MELATVAPRIGVADGHRDALEDAAAGAQGPQIVVVEGIPQEEEVQGVQGGAQIPQIPQVVAVEVVVVRGFHAKGERQGTHGRIQNQSETKF